MRPIHRCSLLQGKLTYYSFLILSLICDESHGGMYPKSSFSLRDKNTFILFNEEFKATDNL